MEYTLNDEELDKLDSAWIFLNLFTKPIISVSQYRYDLVNNIYNNYDADTFYKLEIICEKLLWNLINKVNYLYEIKNDRNICIDCETNLTESGFEKVMNKFYEDNSYRSFINKLVLVDDINNKLYHRPMEGTSIFYNNEFNSTIWKIMSDRQLYDVVMINPKEILNIPSPKYYVCGDYGFPNLNFGKPFIQSDSFRKKRIKKMFYKINSNDFSNWYKLIKPN